LKYTFHLTSIKKLAALVASFLFIQTSHAQSFKASAFAGFSMSQISGDNLGGYNKPGILGGIAVEKEINEKWNLMLQMMYIQKGSRKYPDFKNSDFTRYSLNLNYIEVPIICQYTFNRFKVELGLSNGVMFKSYVANENGLYPINSDEQKPFHKWELSYNLGLSIPLSKKMELCGRINHSILPVRINRAYQLRWVDRGQFNDVLIWFIRYRF
jgi:hypothetical protein